MRTEALFPDAPAMVREGDRRFVTVPWEDADILREALAKRGCPTTLCLNPETRQARLELWPGVTTEAVLAVLEARQPRRPGATADPADLICV
jgi:hypothetical protein